MPISAPAMGPSPLAPLNPSNPSQFTAGRILREVEPSNCMERIVQWLSSDETSLLLKIGAIAMPVIATVGVGILVGYPLLISAIVLIPTTLWAMYAGGNLADRGARQIVACQEQEFCRAMHGSVRGDPQASANLQQMLSEVLEGSREGLQASFICNSVLSEMRRNPQTSPTLQRMLNETRVTPRVSVPRMLSEIREDPQASANLQQILSEMISQKETQGHSVRPSKAFAQP